jgi:serine/threonine protein kinase/tetratricopeptide (TPR) repeat protein
VRLFNGVTITAGGRNVSLVGKTVAHFTIVGELGKGGMGIVYDAQDSRLPRRVALKFLPEDVAFDESILVRFKREAESLSRLNHPYICTIYETGTYHRQPFIAMERLEGETLRQRLDRGTLTFPEIVDIGLQIADALGAAHAQHIVHRDVKPGNVFITMRGMAKLLDFGLAKETRTGVGESGGRASETATGRPLGTAGCMSPEQICQRKIDGRSDLFSLGSLLYLMTCGTAPFQGASVIETIHNVMYEDPQPPSALRQDIPPALETVILRLLRKSPEDRYASAHELMAALRHIKDGVPAGSSQESLAVLPFANTGGGPENHFGDGLAEELITSLSRLEGLRIVSRASSSEVTSQDVIDIGRRLGVRSVLHGSFRRAGDRIRISARLVEVATGAHLWSEKYDRDLHDIFGVQEDVAEHITQALRERLQRHAERPLIRRTAASDVETRPLYEDQARQQPAVEDFTGAVESFAAVSEEPKFTQTLTGIVDHQTRLGLYGMARPMDIWPEVKAKAAAALATDPGLAAAHASLGVALSQYDWDFPGAEREYREAIRLNPGDARARYFYSLHLMSMGQLDAAEREITAGIGLDPLSKPMVTALAYIHYYAGNHDAALRECRRVIALDPRYFETYGCLGLTEIACGNLAAGIDALRKADRLSRGLFTRARAFLAYGLAIGGDATDARAVLDRLQIESKKRYVPPAHLAMAAISNGEFERAFAALEDAFIAKDGTLLLLQLLPVFDPLRSDDRFGSLCRRVGLPDVNATGAVQREGEADASRKTSRGIGVLGSTRLPTARR